ncbi:MAG: type II RES/Xre toxin-antitoxin system antitoxin [Candidatus Nitrospinota bacterium M3_3B_026]|jgi:putative toxin-antitoxin system antitoxin component (TIGR02293 family)
MPSTETSSTAASIIPEIGSDPVAAVRAGLPYQAVKHVQEHLEAPDELLARAMGISTRTLSRRREAGTLTTGESDRLVLLAEIVALARQALDSAETAREWLSTPHSMLGGESPLDHMDTVAGMEEVKNMLYHIEYGLPA